ncbi:hypothetical protein BCR43DRAFT_495342 [Syncephalastrum racemosum]|uniref:Rho GTPase activation protein n=1 Tax=Syncephalastrum racemosum TaxID=13706 RepID=A0A1X2H5Q9_SYNRA|nr:hypothetical protein BCR43DRAFT_495342 [Syncephalastrum racemosum]
MVQYLIAVWDYAAEGDFELSFKQGDRIKLLEKHNDDWWEGELNDEIGFFPVNRIRLEEEVPKAAVNGPSDTISTASAPPPETEPISIANSSDPPQPAVLTHKHKHSAPAAYDLTENITQSDKDNDNDNDNDKPPKLPPRKLKDDPPSTNDMPAGWQHAYDDEGTIYYFNEHTGESRWDKPTEDDIARSLDNMNITSPPMPHSESIDSEEMVEGLTTLNPADMQKLQLDQLHPSWIRQQGFVQMKMKAEKDDGGKLSSWKVYYAVLSKGFLLLYKDSYSKTKKYAKPLLPVGSFDLDACQIEPAGKQDTRRKHSFLITTAKKVTIYIQTSSEKELASWLDAIMRELVARKENSQEMKVNRKILKKTAPTKDGDDKDNGKPKKRGHWFNKPGKSYPLPERPIAGIHSQPVAGDDSIFGGYLHMEPDGSIPRVVRLCVEEVEARGLTSVGIYRLSGPASAIQKYRAAFNRNENISFADEPDINVATGLLKLYFRELRNPLLTHEYYDWFIDAARIPDYDERMFRIKSIIHVLPKANFVVLEYLARHLNNVMQHSEINKMEASNLALIFSVGLLRGPQEDLSSIMHTDLQSKVMEAIIQQVDWFFELDEDDEEHEGLTADVEQ